MLILIFLKTLCVYGCSILNINKKNGAHSELSSELL